MSATQTELIFNALRRGPLTSKTASDDYGCVHLPRRIADLKDLGVLVLDEFVPGKNRYGKTVHYKVYTLDPSSPIPTSFAKPSRHKLKKRTPRAAALIEALVITKDAPTLIQAQIRIGVLVKKEIGWLPKPATPQSAGAAA